MSYYNEILGIPNEVNECNAISNSNETFQKMRIFKALMAFNDDNIRLVASRNNLDIKDSTKVINGKNLLNYNDYPDYVYQDSFSETINKVIDDYISRDIEELTRELNKLRKMPKWRRYIKSIKRRFEETRYEFSKRYQYLRGVK